MKSKDPVLNEYYWAMEQLDEANKRIRELKSTIELERKAKTMKNIAVGLSLVAVVTAAVYLNNKLQDKRRQTAMQKAGMEALVAKCIEGGKSKEECIDIIDKNYDALIKAFGVVK